MFANACGFRSSICCRVICTKPALSPVFWQFWHEHSWQNTPAAKHSQYSFRHLDFLQLHFLLSPSVFGSSPSFVGDGVVSGPAGRSPFTAGVAAAATDSLRF